MSLLRSMMREGGVPSLMDALEHRTDGVSRGVLVAGVGAPTHYDAIVGRLKVEAVSEFIGTGERTSYRDTCQVSVRCPAGTLFLKSTLLIHAYAAEDATLESNQVLFYVRSIDSVSEEMTTVQAWRESLAKVQRRGTEGAN